MLAHRASFLLCIDRMVFDENGHIKPVRITFEGVEAIRLGGEDKQAED